MKIFSKVKLNIKKRVEFTDHFIGTDLLANLDKLSLLSKYDRFLILSDKTVFGLYGKKLLSGLTGLKKPVSVSIVPIGEKSKNLLMVPEIIRPFFENGIDRNSCLIAIGGGVVTDIGVFISCILLRGIDLVNIPTTLLGQVDAGVGGKGGVDLWLSEKIMYKNMLGVIKQPKMVLSDINTLSTLPDREIINGFGEIVKYWIGWGTPDLKTKLDLTAERLHSVISTCQSLKLSIVEKDPDDKKHIREKLNLGHTIGHAIESEAKGELLHGEAVALGLVAVVKISQTKGLLNSNQARQIIRVIKKLGLPVSIKNVSLIKIKTLLNYDKKGGKFVLIKDIGKIITNVPVENLIIEKALKEVIL